MHFLYKNWARPSLLFALIIMGFLFYFKSDLSTSLFWIWLQIPLYLVHQFEEHVWPGKFKEFINQVIFHSNMRDIPMNPKTVFWTNILVIWILFPVIAICSQWIHPKIGAFLPFFALFNATTHILAFGIKRKYNPGLFISVFFNYPLGIYALIVLNESCYLTWTATAICFTLTLFIHLAIVFCCLYRFRNRS